ncbi:hypothetical protein BU332_22720 [Salmonella enterica]|nr:hypothetical protein [Salmonella enterica]EBR1292731.1 hypothetical protein [Salmonella enterica]
MTENKLGPCAYITSYAGTYRLAVYPNGQRKLQVRRGGKYAELAPDIPRHVRGPSAAAAYLGV